MEKFHKVGRALPPPSMFTHPVKRYKDKIRFLFGRTSNRNYVRLFPNFGFRFTVGEKVYTYSRYRGMSVKKVS